jgi:uncharacterized membrane protein YhfC
VLYLAFPLQVLIVIGCPIALVVLLRWRLGVSWGVMVAGAVTFVASQVVHLPLNWGLGLLGGGRGVALWPLPWMALVAGLSAGLCEEGARYLVLRFWRRDARSWAQGVGFGAGHGGIEAVILGLLVAANFLGMAALRGKDMAEMGYTGELLAQVEAGITAYWATPWYLPLVGALERLLTMVIHIGLSLLVVRAVARRRVGWLLAAVGFHALVDGLHAGRFYEAVEKYTLQPELLLGK